MFSSNSVELEGQEIKSLKPIQDNASQPCFIIDGYTHDLIPGNGLKPVHSELSKLSKTGVNGVGLKPRL